MDGTEPNEYRGMDILTLRSLLEFNTQFQERRKIRAAIREAKLSGASLGGKAGGDLKAFDLTNGRTKVCTAGDPHASCYRASLTFIGSNSNTDDNVNHQGHTSRNIHVRNVGRAEPSRSSDSSGSQDGDFFRAVRVNVSQNGAVKADPAQEAGPHSPSEHVNKCICFDENRFPNNRKHYSPNENRRVPFYKTSHLTNTHGDTNTDLIQENHNAADIDRKDRCVQLRLQDSNLVSAFPVHISDVSHPDQTMAAPQLSTVSGLASYGTSDLGHAPLMSNSSVSNTYSSASQIASMSTPSSQQLSNTNSLQFLDGIRERLGRTGSNSDLSPNSGVTTRTQDSSYGDLASKQVDSNANSRARSNFLSRFYSQRESTKPTGSENNVRQVDKEKSGIDNNNSKGLFNSISPQSLHDKANQLFLSSSLPSADAQKPRGTNHKPRETSQDPRETIQSGSAYGLSSQTNVLAPRGVSTLSSAKPSDSSSPVRPPGSIQQSKQVRFSDQENFQQTHKDQPFQYADHQSNSRSTHLTTTKLGTRLGDSNTEPSASATTTTTPAHPPGAMRSESTQTNKSALLRNSSKPRPGLIDLQSKTSSSSSSLSNYPDKTPRAKSVPSPVGNQPASSPPAFPITYPGPRRHSSFDAFNFTKFSPEETSPSSTSSPPLTGQSPRSPGLVEKPDTMTPGPTAPPRLGVSGIRTVPSDIGLRAAMQARLVSPTLVADGIVPVTVGVAGSHLHRPVSPQTSQISSSRRPSSPRTAVSNIQTSSGQGRRLSLPDPSAMTKQQLLDALKNASDIRDKYGNSGGSTVSMDRLGTGNHGSQSNAHRPRRLLSDDAFSMTTGSDRAVSPSGFDSSPGRSSPADDVFSLSTTTSKSPGSPSTGRSSASVTSRLQRASSDAVTAADARKSRDIGLRGKLAGMSASSLLPSKQLYGNNESIASPTGQLSPRSFRSQNQQQSVNQLSSSTRKSETDRAPSPSGENMDVPKMYSVASANPPHSSQSPPPHQRRSSAFPSIPDVRGFLPVSDQNQQQQQKLQHRRRSLRSDGLDEGQGGHSSVMGTGTGRDSSSFRLAGTPGPAFTPTSAQTKHGSTDDSLAYSHIDSCQSELDLTEMLTTSEDFNERRRIRARMRELKTLQQRKGSNAGAPTKPVHVTQPPSGYGEGSGGVDGRSKEATNRSVVTGEAGTHTGGAGHDDFYRAITDVAELQKLLAVSPSAEERHRIRDAIRHLRHSDIEQLKLGKPRSSSDPWTDNSSPNTDILHENKPGQDIPESGKPTSDNNASSTPRPIDLSKYLSQNSASISNSSGSNGINGSSDGNCIAEVDKAISERDSLVTVSTRISQITDSRPTEYDYNFSQLQSAPHTERRHDNGCKNAWPSSESKNDATNHYDNGKGNASNTDENLNNDVFVSVSAGNGDHQATPVVITVTGEGSSAREVDPSDDVFLGRTNFTKSRHQYKRDDEADGNVTSVLDQVKDKLRSRSEGLSARGTSGSRSEGLNQHVSASGRTSPTPYPRTSISGGLHTSERRASDRYREIRDHILGGALPSSDSREISTRKQHDEQEEKQLESPQQQGQQEQEQKNPPFKDQSNKKRQSKIPVPTWRRSKSVSRPSKTREERHETHYTDLGTQRGSFSESGHLPSSLAAKFSEFRHDLDKEEELLKHVTERRPSSLSGSLKDPLPSETLHAKFVVVGTAKAQEDKVIPLETPRASSGDTNDEERDFLSDLNTKSPEAQVEENYPVSRFTEPFDQEHISSAPPPVEFRDESSLQLQVSSSTDDSATLDETDYSFDKPQPIITQTFFTEGTSLSQTKEDTESNFIPVELDEEERSPVKEDPPIPSKRTSSIKRSRPVRKSATISYSARDRGQLDRIEENQERVSPTPVPRRRKSGFPVCPRPDEITESNTAVSVEEYFVPPPSGFSDTSDHERSINKSGDSTREHNTIDEIRFDTYSPDTIDNRSDILGPLHDRGGSEKPKAVETEEITDYFETIEPNTATTSEPAGQEKSSEASSGDSSEFWRRLIADPSPGPESPRATPSGRRPLRSSVPVFGNYPKSSPQETSEGGQAPSSPATVKRRHSDVSNRPNMEQLFSSLLDDLDKASQSESGPSDLDLSDGEDLLGHSSGSNSSGKGLDPATVSPTPTRKLNTTSNGTETDTLILDSTTSAFTKPKSDTWKDLQMSEPNDNVLERNGDLNGLAETRKKDGNSVAREDEIIPSKRPQRKSGLQMFDGVDGTSLYSKEDSGIGLGMEEVVPASNRKAEIKATSSMPASAKPNPDAMSIAAPPLDIVGQDLSRSSKIADQSGSLAHSKPEESKYYKDTESDDISRYRDDDSLNNNNNVTNNNNNTINVDLSSKATPELKTLGEDSSSRSSRISKNNNNNSNNASASAVNVKDTMNEIVTSSTTLTLAQPSENIPYRDPPAVSTVKTAKPSSRAVSKRTFDVNEEDDGSVTYQASSEEPGQNRTVTVRTRRLRTPSDATEELRDTIVERKYRVQRPSGKTQQDGDLDNSKGSNGSSNAEGSNQVSNTDPFADVVIEERDVVRTKKRLTSRGSNYYSRSAVTTRLRRDRHGAAQTVEHDVVVESGAKSVSKGKSWGNRAETHVTTLGDDENDALDVHDIKPSSPNAEKESSEYRLQDKMRSDLSGPAQRTDTENRNKEDALSAEPPGSHDDVLGQGSKLGVSGVKVGMDLSKVSSGYGSGGASEEEGVSTKPAEQQTPAPAEEIPKQIEGPPEVVQVLRDTTLCEGRSLTLECAFSTSQLDRVIWFKDDVEVSVERDGVCRYDSDTGKAILSVSQATIFDTALYVCAARNEAGEARTSCRVVVKRRPEKPPSFETGLSDVTITEGHSTVLTCVLVEAETVAWYKDGIVQRNSSDFKQTFDGRCARLEIGEVFLDDVGEYACVAKNEAGESRSSCRLDVDACGSETTVVPMFLTKMSNKVVNSGDTLRLECDVIGTPEPNITWTKDGEELSSELSFSTCYDGRLATLELSSMRMEEAGTYRCVASNPAGRVSMDAEVIVQVKNQVPFFVSTPDDVSTQVGRSVLLKCEVRGVPRPLVIWRQDGTLVGDSARCIQSHSGGVAKLEVLGVALSDGGVYECVAKNDVGQVTCSCTLTVVDPKASAQRQTSAPREEQVSSAPAPAITVRRRTFKKLSEPRPADIISAVLQRAATSPRGVQRAQSFSPQSTSARSSAAPSAPGTPRTAGENGRDSAAVADSTGIVRDDNVSGLSEFSAAVSGNSRLLEGDTNSKSSAQPTLHRMAEDNASSANEDSGKESSKGNESSPVEKSDNSTDVMRSPRVESLRLSEPESSKQAPTKPKATNLGRSASMHTVRNNNFLSPREDGRSPSPSTIKPVWVPGERTLDDVITPREETVSNSSSVEKLSEVPSPGDIPGYRSVSPMCLKSSNDERKDNSFGNVDAGPDEQGPSRPGNTVHRAFSEPTPSPSGLSQQQPPAPSIIQSKPDSISSPLSFSTPPLHSDTTSATSTQYVTLSKEKTTSETSRSQPTPTSTAASSQPSTPSVPSSTPSSSVSSSTSSLQSPARDTQSDLDLTSRSTAKPGYQQQQQQPQAAPIKPGPGKSISPRVSELRLQFLKNDEDAARNKPRPSGGGGVRRWHSLPPQEFKPKVIKRDIPAQSTSTVNMAGAYDHLTDEEELHKMMMATEDITERKAIRGRLREIREKAREEMEAKRKEREARAEDHVKKKFLQAEEQKRRTMEAYSKQGPTHERESKYHTFTETMIQEKQKLADEEKAAKMAAYSTTKTTVGPGGETVTTSIVTEKTAGGSVAKQVVQKTMPGKAPAGGAKPAEETARELTEQLMRASGPGVRGQITVKTESWNSADGKVEKSEKTQTWGGKPQGARGAMAAFKQMDNATNPAPARPKVARSPSAIKQVLLDWTKAMTREYTEVEITNFSTSWNNGMAFCALIHHFYPDDFDFKSLDPKQRRKNFTLAFDTAENHGMAPLLDVEDMVRMKTPDWKCVFTYVQSLYRNLQNHENNKAKAVSAEQ